MLLRSRYRGDASAVVHYAHAHSRLARRSSLVLKILDEVNAHDMTDAEPCLAAVRRLMKLESASHAGYKEVSYRARQIIVRKQDESRKSRRERMKAIERAGGNKALVHARQESLSDFGMASAGSLYGSADDLGNVSDVTSETESMSNAGGATPGDRPKRRSVGTLFLDNTNTLARFNSYANLAEENGVMRAGADDLFGDDDGYNWGTLFEAPSETEKFAAIESLFDASGVDLRAIKGAGLEVFQGEPGVTFVRLDGGRNLVLFAPSLGHAVAALPEASTQKPEELSFVISYPRLHGREASDVRDAAAAFVSGQHLAGPSPRPPRASPSPSSPSARRLSTSPLRAPAPPFPPRVPEAPPPRPSRPDLPRTALPWDRLSPPRGSSRRSPSRVDSGRTSRRRWRWSAWQTSRWSASA